MTRLAAGRGHLRDVCKRSSKRSAAEQQSDGEERGGDRGREEGERVSGAGEGDEG